jgi:regulator of sigma E protease
MMNWFVAFVIFTVLAWAGMPHFIENQFQIDSDIRTIGISDVTVSNIMNGSPAAQAGLRDGDVLVSMRTTNVEDLNRTYIHSVDDVLKYDEEHAGQSIYITYERGGDTTMVETKLNEAGAEYILGATISGEAVYQSTWSAPIVGLGVTAQLTGETFKGVGQMIVNLFSGAIKQVSPNEEVRADGSNELKQAGDSVSGPVGIVGVLFPKVAQSGGRNLAYLVALISVSLACMNVLPIPALDGGRWLLIAIYKLLKKKLTKETEEKIVSRAFMVILAIALIVTILDITRIVG